MCYVQYMYCMLCIGHVRSEFLGVIIRVSMYSMYVC